MNPMALIVILAIGWVAVTGGFTIANLVLGGVVATLVVYLVRHQLVHPPGIGRLWRVLRLVLQFVAELLLSALGVAKLVLTPDLTRGLRPAIIAFPLTATGDAEITLLANLITLTPGTLTIDVSADRKRLYVHVLSLGSKEKLVRDLASGFEKNVIEVFR